MQQLILLIRRSGQMHSRMADHNKGFQNKLLGMRPMDRSVNRSFPVPAAGVRLLCFLAGAPDYSRGAVLQMRAPQQLQQAQAAPAVVAFEGSFADINPYSYASIPQAAPAAPHPTLTQAASKQNGSIPQASLSPASSCTVWLLYFPPYQVYCCCCPTSVWHVQPTKTGVQLALGKALIHWLTGRGPRAVGAKRDCEALL